jgi:hyaluronan synthase
MQVPDSDFKNYYTRISDKGKIQVPITVWIFRISVLAVLILFPVYRIIIGAQLYDPFIIYSTIIPAINVLVLSGAWFWYRCPTVGSLGFNNETPLVSVIIPVYNQKNMIEIVIDAVYRSNYKNIELIVVNDGSIDGTKEILDSMVCKYPSLKVIHQKRGGKRKASSTGFYHSKGKYVLNLDSDSVIDKNAINEIIKTFNARPKVGAIVGEIRIWNANKKLLTKIQDAWTNVSCNINKAYESTFGSVVCCSGSLSAFRREALVNFMPYWADSDSLRGGGDDRELTAYVMASHADKSDLLKTLWPSSQFKRKLMETIACYDDADDRLLTAHSLIKWESVYVATAFTYVEAQETWNGFIKQQTRWKKGFLRASFYLATFFWKGRNPLASMVYYLDVISSLTTPFVVLTVLLYEPLVLNLLWTPLAFIGGVIFAALAYGIDIKLRHPKSKTWKYMPLMNLLGTFVLSWLIFRALWTFKNNSWLTR